MGRGIGGSIKRKKTVEISRYWNGCFLCVYVCVCVCVCVCVKGGGEEGEEAKRRVYRLHQAGSGTVILCVSVGWREG